jgi:hypothetical protein
VIVDDMSHARRATSPTRDPVPQIGVIVGSD